MKILQHDKDEIDLIYEWVNEQREAQVSIQQISLPDTENGLCSIFKGREMIGSGIIALSNDPQGECG